MLALSDGCCTRVRREEEKEEGVGGQRYPVVLWRMDSNGPPDDTAMMGLPAYMAFIIDGS